MATISASVGNKGKNLVADVRTVQQLLNQNLHHLFPLLPLKVDGACGPVTVGMITDFQRRRVGMSKPDGRVDPGGKTLEFLNKGKFEPQEKDVAAKGFDRLLLLVQ
jgi:peptidoglycan hydrolase-like protein with peptidoglycan-binding domain